MNNVQSKPNNTNNQSKILFTSDIHAFHKNIIKYDSRPFFTVSEMNNALITNWNNKVTSKDTIYVLGDVSWGNESETDWFISQLNGTKHLIIGNHDKVITKSKKLQSHFTSMSNYAKITVPTYQGNKTVILSHYFIPLYDGHFKGAIHLHGHSHNTAEHYEEIRIAKMLNDKGFENQIYNVGCMHWNYEPVTLDEVLVNNE